MPQFKFAIPIQVETPSKNPGASPYWLTKNLELTVPAETPEKAFDAVQQAVQELVFDAIQDARIRAL